ncbi:uncharacterized protein LOC129618198 [Condylostylus longicornis]|uniref:uncharacterized protein LOC129618198 n=1 Tax=Condylostylus longicornis TaxID=2530218 RepID=UPI00244E1A20|nr:uncharacterized protein LOC129618198 [Condylostylus longicornis]
MFLTENTSPAEIESSCLVKERTMGSQMAQANKKSIDEKLTEKRCAKKRRKQMIENECETTREDQSSMSDGVEMGRKSTDGSNHTEIDQQKKKRRKIVSEMSGNSMDSSCEFIRAWLKKPQVQENNKTRGSCETRDEEIQEKKTVQGNAEEISSPLRITRSIARAELEKNHIEGLNTSEGINAVGEEGEKEKPEEELVRNCRLRWSSPEASETNSAVENTHTPETGNDRRRQRQAVREKVPGDKEMAPRPRKRRSAAAKNKPASSVLSSDPMHQSTEDGAEQGPPSSPESLPSVEFDQSVSKRSQLSQALHRFGLQVLTVKTEPNEAQE